MAISDLFARLRMDEVGAGAGASDAPVQPTMALARFLIGLGARQRPVLLDLGPVVASNIAFFNKEVGCRVLVEDLSRNIDRHINQARVAELTAFFDGQFPQESDSIDGILCWDIFDYLEPPAAERLVRQLTRVLRPDGLLLAFFGTADPRSAIRPTYTRHVVIDRAHLQFRPVGAERPKQRPWLNRDIQRLFDPLRITETFLLTSNLREVLCRKPGDADLVPLTPPPAER